MSETSLFAKATDALQYDRMKVNWEQESTLKSPYRLFFWEYLSKYRENWKDKNVLDIGAGTGWLLHEIIQNGAKSGVGIEPSENNAQMAKKLFPDIKINNVNLRDFTTEDSFDIVFSTMVFSHIGDVEEAFKKVKSLVLPKSEIYIIVPNFDYYLEETEGREVLGKEKLSDDEYVVEVKRPNGVIVDIARTNNFYIQRAAEAGLSLKEMIPMTPTQQLMDNVERYRKISDKAITDLLVFAV